MLKNITERRREEKVYYSRDFQKIDEFAGCGFGFDCDAEGNLSLPNEGQKENYEYALAHPELFEDLGVTKCTVTYIVPATGTCHCGETVELVNQYLGACECPRCGQWYNLFGQELNPPNEWEEPTDW